MTRSWKAISVLLAAGATAGSVPLFAQEESAVILPKPEANAKAARVDDTPVFEVKPGKLSLSVEEWGLLEATRNQDVFNRVEGQTTIISLVPEGTKVTKGQVVCELDWSSLSDQLTNQVVAVKGAEAAFRDAKLTREIAELGLLEYQEGTYPQQLNSLGEEVIWATMAIQKAEERRDRTLRARKRLDDLLGAKGRDRTAAEIVADLDIDDRLEDVTQTLSRARTALAQAKIKRDVLEKFTGVKKTDDLKREVEKARSDEQAKQRAWELEQAKDAKLRRQIQDCKLVAPADGVVVYADNPLPTGPTSPPKLQEGDMVRERQKVFSIPDLSGPMRVNVKVPESLIEWVTPGLPARIKVDVFAGEALPGVVESIAPLPDPSTVFDRNTRVYPTYIAIVDGPPGLTPGITAQVEILTTALDDVLSVPVPAVVYYDRKDHVAVKKPDGGFDWREVSLGLSTGPMVEVKQGLKSGEAVALGPASLLSGGQKLKISLSPPKPAPKPKRKGAGISPALWTKLRAINPEEFAKMKGASSEEREAILKKAGFTDDEIRQIGTR